MNSTEYARINGKAVEGEAILFMKSRPPRPDGTVGFVVKPDMREWDAWLAYFQSNGMHQRAAFMQSRGFDGYTVPSQLPTTFDPSWRYRPPPPVEREKYASEMTAEEREATIRRVMRRINRSAAE